jgi:hypothetical protein
MKLELKLEEAMNEKEWMSIPVLRSVSLDETLSFWESLGFERTYYQKSPYPYGVVSRGGYGIHFVHQKGLNPAESPYGCLVMVSDVQAVHQDFSNALRERLGRVPNKGLPRISRMRPQQTRFTLTDPSGNWVIFIQYGAEDSAAVEKSEDVNLVGLEKAIAKAIRFREFKEEPDGAAKILDIALEKYPDDKAFFRVQALLLRAEIALDMEETDKAKSALSDLRQIALTEADRAALSIELARAEELENGL